MSKPLLILVCGIARTTMMSQPGILTQTELGMLMIERVLRGVVFMQVIILSPRRAKSRIPSLYPLQKLNRSLSIAAAPNFYGCKNFFLVMVFVKNILPSIVTILVSLTSLRILFNILELNTQRFDITSFGSLSKMVLSLLSLFTLMIRRLIYSPSLLIANGLNSFAKTLMLSLWIDFLFFFLPPHAFASIFMLCFV